MIRASRIAEEVVPDANDIMSSKTIRLGSLIMKTTKSQRIVNPSLKEYLTQLNR